MTTKTTTKHPPMIHAPEYEWRSTFSTDCVPEISAAATATTYGHSPSPAHSTALTKDLGSASCPDAFSLAMTVATKALRRLSVDSSTSGFSEARTLHSKSVRGVPERVACLETSLIISIVGSVAKGFFLIQAVIRLNSTPAHIASRQRARRTNSASSRHS
jgi:hypothetical protein